MIYIQYGHAVCEKKKKITALVCPFTPLPRCQWAHPGAEARRNATISQHRDAVAVRHPDRAAGALSAGP